jgi:hypothetical protein
MAQGVLFLSPVRLMTDDLQKKELSFFSVKKVEKSPLMQLNRLIVRLAIKPIYYEKKHYIFNLAAWRFIT